MVKKKLKKKGGGHGVSAQELREREKLRRANAQADEERARRKRLAETKIRNKMMEDAKKDAAKYVTERILPYSPIRDTVDQRVYEIMRYKYQRPVHKDPNYLKPKLPKDFYDTETRLRMGDNERAKAVRAEEEKREAGEREIMAEEERLARYGPRIKMNLVGAGQGWQSPFEMLYTQEEKELMGLLNGKNPLIRIKPDPGGEVGGPNYDHSQRHRWGQDRTWPIAWSNAAPPPNTPHHLFDGLEYTQWDPTDSVVGQTHWVVLDLRSVMDIDAFRIQSNPSIKNCLRFFRFECGKTANGPWEVKDYYEHRNIDAHFGSKEVYSEGFDVTTQHIRFYCESCSGANLQPKIQDFALRFVAPTVHPMAMAPKPYVELREIRYKALLEIQERYQKEGIIAMEGDEDAQQKLNDAMSDEADKVIEGLKKAAEHEAQSMRVMPRIQIVSFEGTDYHGEIRLAIHGSRFSSHAKDNKVLIVPVTRNDPDHNHKEVWWEERLELNTLASENIKMSRPTATVHESSRECVVVSISGLERKHFGYLAAVVCCTGQTFPDPLPLVGVAQVVETFEDISDWVTSRLKPEPPKTKEEGCFDLLAALKVHCFNEELVYWAFRAIAKGFDSEMDPDLGVPRQLSLDAMDTVVEVLAKNRENVYIAGWAMQALVRFTGDEHGNRMALMSNDTWLEFTTSVLCELVITHKKQYKQEIENEDGTKDYEIVEETQISSECCELAHYGLTFLCSMALEEKVRDYVASLGLQTAMHCMEMCMYAEDECVQAVGCQAIFYMVFRCEDAWKQADEFGALQLVTAARDLNLLNETLQKWAGNAIAVLQPDGWKGRKLAQEMKLNEAMVHRKKKAQDEKEGKGKKKKRPGDDSSDDEDGRGGADGRPPWF